MGVTYIIGNAELDPDLEGCSTYQLHVPAVHHPDAPRNYLESGLRSNVLGMSYTGRSEFARALGLVTEAPRGVSWIPKNMMALPHNVCLRLTPAHLDVLRAAQARELSEGHRLWLDWWIWWVDWALKNCKRPAVYNH